MKIKTALIPSVLVIFLLFFSSFSRERKVNIWMIGDSTMALKKPERAPESGWGEGLKLFVNRKAVVHNHAASGRSTKSFISEQRWQNVLDSIQKGDYLIIQFGHNDEKQDPKLHAGANRDFKTNIQKFVVESRLKGGNPIICSSIVRRHFDGLGNLKDTHGEYIKATKEIAEETKTPYIDMEAATRKLVVSLGPEESKKLFVFCEPGECSQRKSGAQDSTHLNFDGTRQVAALFVKEIKKENLPIKRLFRNVEK